MTQSERDRFDHILEQVLRDLPMEVRNLFDEAPLIIEDEPPDDVMEDFELNPDDDTLCGLYTGTPMTERSLDEPPHAPDHIHIYRRGVIEQAGGWEAIAGENGECIGGETAISREIRITILHELGHHFGLDEDDLAKMGYD